MRKNTHRTTPMPSCTTLRAHSKASTRAPDACAELRKEWANVLRVRNSGVPIVGFTWYSLTDQVDWDSALRENNCNVNALGLYDLDRKMRPVGSAYQKLIADWREVLPTQSICLQVPIVMPEQAQELAPAAQPAAPDPTAATAAPANTQ